MTKFGAALAAASLAISLSACGGGTSGGGSPDQDQILVTVRPSTTSVPTTQGKNFHAYVFHDLSAKGVEWKLSGMGCTGDGCGTLSHVTTESVTYIAPSTPPVPAAVTLTSTAIADPTKSAAAKVFVFAPGTISISVTPVEADVKVGDHLQLTATVANDVANAGVVWTVGGSSCGVFIGVSCGAVSPAATASGLPTTYSSPGQGFIFGSSLVHVVATSATDPSVSTEAIIHLICTDLCIP